MLNFIRKRLQNRSCFFTINYVRKEKANKEDDFDAFSSQWEQETQA